ncbi:RNA 3'-terminal phosphate cyclase [Candidatus Woesearchaeota archaeon]|nr:RNA 3'-terminal phosphate cyclase [Candidatus Woesearchaeota archaeon]
MIVLDGSVGEGGGQILRTALALSILTQKSFKITNIRKGRCDSGLKAQHVACIRVIDSLGACESLNVKVGQEDLEFTPKPITNFSVSFDVKTAGSTTLLLQSVLLPLMFAKKSSKLTIIGGTDVSWSMPVDYLKNVMLAHLQKYAKVELKIVKRGYFPKGNGKIEVKITPQYNNQQYDNIEQFINFLSEQDTKIDLLEQGKLLQVRGISHASTELLQANVADRQSKAAKLMLSKLKVPINIQSEYTSTTCAGSGITLYGMFSISDEISQKNPIILGSDALGKKSKRSEDVGTSAARKLIDTIESNAPVDEYLADNLIPFLALFGGQFRASKITNHTLTNILVVEKFLPVKFIVENNTITINPN